MLLGLGEEGDFDCSHVCEAPPPPPCLIPLATFGRSTLIMASLRHLRSGRSGLLGLLGLIGLGLLGLLGLGKEGDIGCSQACVRLLLLLLLLVWRKHFFFFFLNCFIDQGHLETLTFWNSSFRPLTILTIRGHVCESP